MPAQFPVTIELSDLDGQNGFTLTGLLHDNIGSSAIGAHDINQDGFPDLIVGAPDASSTAFGCGQTFVIYGGAKLNHSSVVSVSELNSRNGIIIDGIAFESKSGYSVTVAEDVNTDNSTDLIIGAYGANPNGFESGQSYVVFGGNSLGSAGYFELSTLDGNNGFVLNGVNAGDLSGSLVATAGDLNNDTIVDFAIGAFLASPNGVESGQSYVVFGSPSLGNQGTVELSNLNGVNGFIINGIAAYDHSGSAIASAGDINADGVADLIIGAPGGGVNKTKSGQSYVIFGREQIGSSGTIELSDLNGKNGFMINYAAAEAYSGFSVDGTGDINRDGLSDLIIGTPGSNVNGPFSGQSFVIFGSIDIGHTGTIELSNLDGHNGFVINGANAYDFSGQAVSVAGDVNGDGIHDLIIGAPGASLNGEKAGQTYVIFGGQSIGCMGKFELSEINGQNGFKLNGVIADGGSGSFVASAGDINADGVGDLFVGSPFISKAHVVFGDFIDGINLVNNELTINQGQTIIVNQNNINATSKHYAHETLQFIISNVEHGQFEYIFNPSERITQFSQLDVINGQVQFVNDWSIFPPSYQVSAFTGRWVRTLPEEAIIDFGPLLLVNNSLTINQYGVQRLSPINIFAMNKNSTQNQIIFTVADLSHGRFEEISQAGTGINQFTQEQVSNDQILFIQDGTANAPNYKIIVSDTIYTLPPSSADVVFFSAPVLQVNDLTIQQGQTVLLNSNNLLASDDYIPSSNLIFSISALEHGRFAYINNSHTPIIQFTQGEVQLQMVQFSQDGSSHAPCFNVSVIANNLSSLPQAAQINWTPKSPKQSMNNAIRDILISSFAVAGLLGGLVLVYMAAGLLKNHRLHAIAKDKENEQKRFYNEVIIPIAKTIFKQIKITGFMNYISTDNMEAYVAEIATVVNEISHLGINIEIQHLSPEQSTELLTHIVKQMKQHLKLETSRCNRAWFTSFFKSQVTPEQIGEKAQAIAQSVHDALLGENKVGIINLPAHVDLTDVIGQAPSEKEFTTGYVQMP